MKKRIIVGVGVVVVVLAVVAGGVRAYMVWQQSQDVLPEFTEAPPGPRAPTRSFLGLDIGSTTVADAELVYRSLNVKCENSSFRALMEANREVAKKKMAEAEARGEDPDGITGASLVNYRSKKERNPQVRLSCPDVPAGSFNDRARVPGDPLHWLIIFDSPNHPLRHTSVSRRVSIELAGEEWQNAVDRMITRFGAATKLLTNQADAGQSFGPGALYQATWEFSDLRAEVRAIRLGKSVSFTERVEVPWPVRADAPSRK